ncbi:MAG TPA: TolC family protein [Methylomirabilota bacterium]|jgi:cobalt-zinc-cadmium efflux system outer membrane protein|nr:TolC family protein [Methylomirabilota bacterium]
MVRIVTAVCCLALLGAAGGVRAQERLAALTLEQALRLASETNPNVRAKEFELKAVGANEITAGLRPNPTANFLAEQFAGGSSASQTQYTINIGQPIELGGKRQRRVDSATAQTKVTSHQLADLRRQIDFQVKKTFTDILVARDSVSLAEQNLAALDDLEKVQRLRADKGDLSGLELLRIQVQRYSLERDAADARQALKAGKIALRALVGPDKVVEDFDVTGALDYRQASFTQSELYRRALDARPDVRAAEAARDKARADINLAKANAWWDITPQVEYQRIGPDNTIGFGVGLPVRIFDRNQGEIARTRADALRVDAVRDAVAVQALSEVDTALAAVQTERGKVLALRDTYLPKATQARDTVEFAYRRGGVNLLDYIDAQRTYRETALEYVRALGNYRTAIHLLEAAVGGSLRD